MQIPEIVNVNINKKILFPSIGVVIFLIVGAVAMFLTQDKPVNDFVPPQQKQTQNPMQIKTEVKTEVTTEINSKTKSPEPWFVYVTGEVRNPGVYKVSPDSRIFNAVEAAGGFTLKADRNSVNMAEHLFDGMQIYISAKTQNSQRQNQTVRVPGVPPSSNIQNTKATTVNSNQNKNLVDINHASESELTKLTGVGAAIAKRIVEYRNSHGRFSKPEDLINVRGIGEKKLEKMRHQILIR